MSDTLVDIGGGRGHDLLAFEERLSEVKLVLQDKPEAIATVDLPATSNIQITEHDFFTPQPEEAQAYFLHSVLHDWDEDQCVSIFKALKPAMSADPVIPVHDLVVPDRKAPWMVTSEDMLMMIHGAAKERDEKDFRNLFDRAGLQIKRIWAVDASTEAIIEAVLEYLVIVPKVSHRADVDVAGRARLLKHAFHCSVWIANGS